MNLNYKILLVFFIFCTPLILTRNIFPDDASFRLRYSTPAETIMIEHGVITHTRFGDVADRTAQSKVERTAPIQSGYIWNIRKLLERTGYYRMPLFLGAPENSEFEPCTIEVYDFGKSQTVTYRSNTSYASAPQDFQRIADAIKNLVHSIQEWRVVGKK